MHDQWIRKVIPSSYTNKSEEGPKTKEDLYASAIDRRHNCKKETVGETLSFSPDFPHVSSSQPLPYKVDAMRSKKYRTGYCFPSGEGMESIRIGKGPPGRTSINYHPNSRIALLFVVIIR